MTAPFVNIYLSGIEASLADRVTKAFNAHADTEAGGRRFITIRQPGADGNSRGEERLSPRLRNELRNALAAIAAASPLEDSSTPRLYIPSKQGLIRQRQETSLVLKERRPVATACAAYKAGATMQALADLWNVPYMTAFRVIAAAGLERPTAKLVDDPDIGLTWINATRLDADEWSRTRAGRLGALINWLSAKGKLDERNLGFKPPRAFQTFAPAAARAS